MITMNTVYEQGLREIMTTRLLLETKTTRTSTLVSEYEPFTRWFMFCAHISWYRAVKQ